MALELELTSPFEIAKDFVLAVQEYTLLAAQSIANLFRRPLYMGDMLQQADLIGFGSLPIVILRDSPWARFWRSMRPAPCSDSAESR